MITSSRHGGWLGFLALMALATAVPVRSAENGAPVTPTSSSAALDWLLGGTWIASVPVKQGAPAMNLELRFESAENRRGLRFASSFVSQGKRAPYTSGLYAWDAAAKSFAMFYSTAEGELARGQVTVEGNVFRHELTLTNADGTVEPLRVTLTRVAPDAFTNEIFLQKNGAWTKFIEVRYERKS